MNAKNIALYKKVVAHWERMIKWAKEQPKGEDVNSNKMFEAIKETRAGIYCVFCRKYHSSKCKLCPIEIELGGCFDIGYNEVGDSHTWGSWVRNAEIFLNNIKKLEV